MFNDEANGGNKAEEIQLDNDVNLIKGEGKSLQ